MRILLATVACAALLTARAEAGKGDITLVGHVPISGSVFITDVWGYYDSSTGKEYAITGDDVLREIYIIDVTNPGSASIKATVTNVAAFDMKVWGHYIYSVDGDLTNSDSNIIDISEMDHCQVSSCRISSGRVLRTLFTCWTTSLYFLSASLLNSNSTEITAIPSLISVMILLISSSSFMASSRGSATRVSISMGPEPGISTIIEEPGTVTSGFSVRGMVTSDRTPSTVRKIRTIQVKERLLMASSGSLIARE